MTLLSENKLDEIEQYYENDSDKNTLRESLLDELAQTTAEELVPLFKNKKNMMQPAKNAVTSSQLRKFFFEFRGLN